jgi:hypothetical protein
VFFFFLTLDKDRELGEAQAEIKALRLSDRLKQKAVDEVYFSCNLFLLGQYEMHTAKFCCFWHVILVVPKDY